MNRLNLELLDIINPYINYESKSLQIRGSEVVEKIIKTNIVERYTFFRCKENVRKLIVEKCSAFKTTKVLFCEHHLAHIASSYEVSGFNEAVGIVVDGIGETAVTSLWRIQNNQYEKIMQMDYSRRKHAHADTARRTNSISYCQHWNPILFTPYPSDISRATDKS